ncbi:MarR family winged helix-turn-helix transcriptional regulator [Chloroflexota bacterium]
MRQNLTTDDDFNTWVLLHQAQDQIFKARDNELFQYGCSTMQSAILSVVKMIEGKATLPEIAKWVLRKPHTISTILTRMEKSGLLKKANGSAGKRTIYVTLTEKGEQVFSQTLKRESIYEIMSCLSKEEQKQLASSLEKLRDKALYKLTTPEKIPFP